MDLFGDGGVGDGGGGGGGGGGAGTIGIRRQVELMREQLRGGLGLAAAEKVPTAELEYLLDVAAGDVGTAVAHCLDQVRAVGEPSESRRRAVGEPSESRKRAVREPLESAAVACQGGGGCLGG
jgi:hypothetical protein